jgi:DNA-binding transcriptional ArsR family regulator
MNLAGRSNSRTSRVMLLRRRRGLAALKSQAPVFAALGDETRLSMVVKLAAGRPQSISQLTEGTRLTRQAVTKHLHVLEKARVVRNIRVGRESLFELKPEAIDEVRAYLDLVSKQWDETLARLKSFVEE